MAGGTVPGIHDPGLSANRFDHGGKSDRKIIAVAPEPKCNGPALRRRVIASPGIVHIGPAGGNRLPEVTDLGKAEGAAMHLRDTRYGKVPGDRSRESMAAAMAAAFRSSRESSPATGRLTAEVLIISCCRKKSGPPVPDAWLTGAGARGPAACIQPATSRRRRAVSSPARRICPCPGTRGCGIAAGGRAAGTVMSQEFCAPEDYCCVFFTSSGQQSCHLSPVKGSIPGTGGYRGLVTGLPPREGAGAVQGNVPGRVLADGRSGHAGA